MNTQYTCCSRQSLSSPSPNSKVHAWSKSTQVSPFPLEGLKVESELRAVTKFLQSSPSITFYRVIVQIQPPNTPALGTGPNSQ